jgi:hypothetical protein
MEFFAPHVQRPTRLLCLVLSAIVLIWLPVWWSLKLAGLVLAAAVFGSYREAWITQERICRQRTVGFIPGKIDQWKRDRLRGVEVIEEPEPPPAQTVGQRLERVQSWLLQRLLPWRYGPLKLKLRLAEGQTVLLWQGADRRELLQNLELLDRETGIHEGTTSSPTPTDAPPPRVDRWRPPEVTPEEPPERFSLNPDDH